MQAKEYKLYKLYIIIYIYISQKHIEIKKNIHLKNQNDSLSGTEKWKRLGIYS